ncbi:uncharacterized protein V2V93DRAFT_365255 [Kockiozyma suomiensis]|uniref:uncharacterized protein n=1 Tax=Kockiozyma suomiensis TaxID=1337062 RepID=UPI0033441EF0
MLSPANFLRRKFRSIFLTDVSPSSTLARLETSWDINKTISRVQAHRFVITDLQYLLDFAIIFFVLCIVTEPGPILRILIAIGFSLLLLIPITSQFFFPFLPIGTWLFLFYSCRFVPASWRPPIWVRVLPSLETIFYGGNLSNVLAAQKSPVLDILAWIPYGLIHFGGPFVCSAVIFLFAAPGTLPVFAHAFGYMNLIGVSIQLMFPNSPPWYENMYGLVPATYDVKGSPGGLARVDQIIGLDLYTSSFTASPMVFGAFPSLHSGCAVIEVLFMSYLFPRLTPYLMGYVLWIWWSTMYLTHHYFVDLIGGAILSLSVFVLVARSYLPKVQPDKPSRWAYDYVELGILPAPKARLTKEYTPGDWTLYNSSDSSDAYTLTPTSEWEIETLADNEDEFNRPLVNANNAKPSRALNEKAVYEG